MILLLGASGYVGRHIFETLGPTQVIGTYRSNPVPGGIYFDATRMRLVDVLPAHADISHALVVYAEADIDACKADVERSYDINVRSTRQIIDDLVQLGIKPVFTSTEYVFDGERGNYREEDAPNPMTVYGSQKVEIEEYLAEHCKDYAVLRLAKVFGSAPEDGTILANWIKQIHRGEEIRCARDQVFSPVHVDDVVASAIAVIRQDLSGIYHVANPQAYSRLDMLRTLIESCPTQVQVVECSIRDFDFLDQRPLDLSMNPRKVLEATGLEFRSVPSCCLELVRRVQGTVAASGMERI